MLLMIDDNTNARGNHAGTESAMGPFAIGLAGEQVFMFDAAHAFA